MIIYSFRNTRFKPSRIIVYRDGVSEGQFFNVSNLSETLTIPDCELIIQNTFLSLKFHYFLNLQLFLLHN